MKKFFKVLALIVVMILILLVLVYNVALSSYAVKNWYVPILAESNGLEIEFADCRLALLSAPMVEFSDVRIAKKGEVKLELAELRADMKVSSLLKRRIDIPELRLKKLQLDMTLPEPASSGAPALPEMVPSSPVRPAAVEPSAPPAPTPAWDFKIGVIELSDADIKVRSGANWLRIAQGKLSLQDFAPGKKFTAALAARLQVMTPTLEIERSHLDFELQSTPDFRDIAAKSQGAVLLRGYPENSYQLKLQAKRHPDGLVEIGQGNFRIANHQKKTVLFALLRGKFNYQNWVSELSGTVQGGNMPLLDKLVSQELAQPVKNLALSGNFSLKSGAPDGGFRSSCQLTVRGDNLPLSPVQLQYQVQGNFDNRKYQFAVQKLDAQVLTAPGQVQLKLLQPVSGSWLPQSGFQKLQNLKMALELNGNLNQLVRGLKLKNVPVRSGLMRIAAVVQAPYYPGAVQLQWQVKAPDLQLQMAQKWGAPATWQSRGKVALSDRMDYVAIDEFYVQLQRPGSRGSAVNLQGQLGLTKGGADRQLQLEWQLPDAALLACFPHPELDWWQISHLQGNWQLQATLPPVVELGTRWNQLQCRLVGEMSSPQLLVPRASGQISGKARWNLAQKQAEIENFYLSCQDSQKHFGITAQQRKLLQLKWLKKFTARNAALQIKANKCNLPVLLRLAQVKSPVRRGELNLKLDVQGDYPGSIAGKLQSQLDNLQLSSAKNPLSNWRWSVQAATDQNFARLELTDFDLRGEAQRRSLGTITGSGSWPLTEKVARSGRVDLKLTGISAHSLRAWGIRALDELGVRNFDFASQLRLVGQGEQAKLTGSVALKQLTFNRDNAVFGANLQWNLAHKNNSWQLPQLLFQSWRNQQPLADLQVQGGYQLASSCPLKLEVSSKFIDLPEIIKLATLTSPDAETQADTSATVPGSSASGSKDVSASKVKKVATTPQNAPTAPTAPATPPPPRPIDLRYFRGDIKVKAHRIRCSALNNLSGSLALQIRQNRLKIDPLQLTINGAPWWFKGEVDCGGRSGFPYEFETRLQQLVLDPLSECCPALEKVRGEVSFGVALRGLVHPGRPGLEALNGWGEFRARRVEFPVKSARGLKLVELIFMPVELALNGISEFRRLQFIPEFQAFQGQVRGILSGEKNFILNNGIGRFSLNSGDLRIPQLEFSGGTVKKESLKGRIYLPTGRMNLQAAVQFLKLTLPMGIEGTLAKPRPDYSQFPLLFAKENLRNALSPDNIEDTGRTIQGVVDFFRKRKK